MSVARPAQPLTGFHSEQTHAGHERGGHVRASKRKVQLSERQLSGGRDVSDVRIPEPEPQPEPEIVPGTPASRHSRRSRSPEQPTWAVERQAKEEQLGRAERQVAALRAALQLDAGSVTEIAQLKEKLAAAEQALDERDAELEAMRTELRARASRDRESAANARAMAARVQEQRDYIAAVEGQLQTTRSKLQLTESRLQEMISFKRRSAELSSQLGQERLQARERLNEVEEGKAREAALEQRTRELLLQRDSNPKQLELKRQMRSLNQREAAMRQVLAAVAGTVSGAGLPSQEAWGVPQQGQPARPTTPSLWAQAAEPPSPSPPSSAQRGTPRSSPRRQRRRRVSSKAKTSAAGAELARLKRRLRLPQLLRESPAVLLAKYDKHRTGGLLLAEFVVAMRKGAELTRGVISDAELGRLFESVHADRNGRVGIGELAAFIFGASADDTTSPTTQQTPARNHQAQPSDSLTPQEVELLESMGWGTESVSRSSADGGGGRLATTRSEQRYFFRLSEPGALFWELPKELEPALAESRARAEEAGKVEGDNAAGKDGGNVASTPMTVVG